MLVFRSNVVWLETCKIPSWSVKTGYGPEATGQTLFEKNRLIVNKMPGLGILYHGEKYLCITYIYIYELENQEPALIKDPKLRNCTLYRFNSFINELKVYTILQEEGTGQKPTAKRGSWSTVGGLESSTLTPKRHDLIRLTIICDPTRWSVSKTRQLMRSLPRETGINKSWRETRERENQVCEPHKALPVPVWLCFVRCKFKVQIVFWSKWIVEK